MRIIPDSTITLYSNIPIDAGEQLVFSSLNNQTAYFQSKIVRQAVPCTVVRKTGRLRIEAPGSVVSGCNYLSFVNPSFDNKTVYAHIIDYDYVNNECVEIAYAIDYWQTWMFDVTFDDMYIEREHLSQADFNKAEINPYDPTIIEFRTAEDLPISKDLEKPNYVIGSDANADGQYLGKQYAVTNSLADGMGALVYLAEIDFEDLDSQSTSPLPSSAYATLLATMIADTDLPLMYIRLTDSQYNYLNSRYPSQIPSQTMYGSGWGSLGRFPSINLIDAPYSYMYIDYGVGYGSYNKGYLSELLTLLTQWDAVGQLIGMYAVPRNLIPFAGVVSGTHTFINIAMGTAAGQNVTNKKLDLFPFSYLRAISPNGDIKEYKFEDFVNVQTNTALQPSQNVDAMLIMGIDIMEKPTLFVMPRKYKMTGDISYRNSEETNQSEALVLGQFPQLPYNIDAYLANIAALSMSVIGNNTIDYSYDIQQKQLNVYKEQADVAKEIVGAVSDALSFDLGGTTSGIINATLGATQAELTNNRNRNEFAMSEDAYKTLSGSQNNAMYNNFKYTRPAFACNEYHMSNGDGTINYNLATVLDILFLRVQLNSDVLARYDRYFSDYGYTSGRCGIPRVINYKNGVTGDANLPHWQTINGKETTFIKTRDCRVTSAMLPVAGFIKNMFDTGVRMIKGDLS